MKRKKISRDYLIAVGFLFLIFLFRFIDVEIGHRMIRSLLSFAREMIVMVPCIFILIGLIDVWIPANWIQKHVGEKSGLKGGIFVILLAVFQGGPLYGAFPVAHILWKKGCNMRNIFIYLGAFSSLKAPMMIFEASFLGWRFTLIRSAVALPIFILIAEVLAVYSRKSGIEMNVIESVRNVG